MSEIDVVRGLHSLRRNGRASVSRVLHDEIGPALCSAGLVMGLLRSEAGRLPPEGSEWLAMLQAAMETAMESARLLSYRTDPALASRCGFCTALEYLTRGSKVTFDGSQGGPKWTAEQNDAACGIVRDILLAIPGQTAHLESNSLGVILRGDCQLNLDKDQRKVLQIVAKLHRLELLYEVPMTAIFSLGVVKAD